MSMSESENPVQAPGFFMRGHLSAELTIRQLLPCHNALVAGTQHGETNVAR
jgi:hypothetical protein